MDLAISPNSIVAKPVEPSLSIENINLDYVLNLTDQLAEEIIYAKLRGQKLADSKISTLVIVSMQLRQIGVQWPASVSFALDAPLQVNPQNEHRTTRLGTMWGKVDEAKPTLVRGWAMNEGDPKEPAILEIVINGVVTAVLTADLFRPDLAEAKIGTGYHGFFHEFSGPISALSQKNIVVRRRFDRMILE